MAALVIAAVAVLYALFIIGRVLIFGIDTPGYASLLIVVLLMGAIQLVSIGIIGEYLGRLFLEVKGRPIYVVEGVYEEGRQPPDRPDGPQGRGHPRRRHRPALVLPSPRPPRFRRVVGRLAPQRICSMSARARASSRATCWPRAARNRRSASISATPATATRRSPASRCSTAATAARPTAISC